ncbi:MAG: S41 family peptidase [Ignavibacteria bacterium]|nr:S41 family peptidase [Ignavibacteria bacterium]
MKVLPGNIYYLNLDRISMNQIDSLSQELVQAKGIICDLRGYPNSNDQFISHLLSIRDTSTSWMQVPEFIYPDQERLAGYRKLGWGIIPLVPHFSAKVAFLIDGRAISYAESYMSFVEHYKLGEIIGEATAGTNGNVNAFRVPGGYRITWTGMKVVKHDGPQHHGIGILPTIPVKRTIAGIRAGKDEFLEKAIEALSK